MCSTPVSELYPEILNQITYISATLVSDAYLSMHSQPYVNIQDVTFREHSREIVHVGNVKIVACEAKPQQQQKSAAAEEDGDDPAAGAGPSGGGTKRKI